MKISTCQSPFVCAIIQLGSRCRVIGESYSGSIAVSKTVHGGSNPSSPVSEPVKVTGSLRSIIEIQSIISIDSLAIL